MVGTPTGIASHPYTAVDFRAGGGRKLFPVHPACQGAELGFSTVFSGIYGLPLEMAILRGQAPPVGGLTNPLGYGLPEPDLRVKNG
jgi:hypothetical protein